MVAYRHSVSGNKRPVRNLAIFTLLMIALGWLGRLVDALLGSTSPQEGLGMLIWIISPLAVSFLLRALAADGWHDLGVRLNIKGNVRGYIVSILVYPVCVSLILVIGLGLAAVSLPNFSPETGPLFVQGFALLLIPQFFQNIFEEFGFRGYLAPKLYTLAWNVMVAHLLVGLIWGIWHLPYLRAITPYTTESLATLMPRFLAGTMTVSIVYGEIRLLTDSVWPAVLMQTIGGSFIGALLAYDFIQVGSGLGFLFAPVLEGGLMIILAAFIGIGIHLWRRNRMATRRVAVESAPLGR